MTRKVLSFVLVLAFVVFLAACESKDTVNSNDSSSTVETSSAVSTVSEASSSEVTSSDTSSGALIGFKDGFFYGDGFSIEVPEGYSILSEAESTVLFKNKDSETMTVIFTSNPTGEKS